MRLFTMGMIGIVTFQSFLLPLSVWAQESPDEVDELVEVGEEVEGLVEVEVGVEVEDNEVEVEVDSQVIDPITGSISGYKYNDINRNGVRDGVELAEVHKLSNWIIYLLDNDWNILEEFSTVKSDASDRGTYRFDDLEAGTYYVCEEFESHWIQTQPTTSTGVPLNSKVSHFDIQGPCYQINLTPGENKTNVLFGNYEMARLYGSVFDDVNENGTKDSGEEFITNVNVNRYDQDWNLLDQSLVNNSGDIANKFMLEKVLPGTYNICLTTQSGFKQTAPTGQTAAGATGIYGQCYTSTVPTTSGYEKDGYDFGIARVVGEQEEPEEGPTGISGYKFNDLDKNGVRSGTEELREVHQLSSWKIYLFDSNWQIQAQDLTGKEGVDRGRYQFENLTPGTYYVCEEFESLWIQSYPGKDGGVALPVGGVGVEDIQGNCHRIELSNQEYPINVNFGNYKAARIRGYKFNDTNNDHLWTTGENAIGSWEIQRYDTNWNLLDTSNTLNKGASSTIGQYTLEQVPVGNYYICEKEIAGWVQTFPTSGTLAPDNLPVAGFCYYVEIPNTPGYDLNNIHFGNIAYPSISGTVFRDINRNGTRDGEELAITHQLTNWLIHLFDNGWGHLQSMETGNAGETRGKYAFNNLLPGTYYICEEFERDWTKTYPNTTGVGLPDSVAVEDVEGPCHQVTLAMGENQNSIDFGNFETAQISGFKFNDNNDNTVWDSNEPGMNNWIIHLYNTDWSHIAEATTTQMDNTIGKYKFNFINPGSYYLCEEFVSGWTQTHPVSGITANGDITEVVYDTCHQVVIPSTSGYQAENYNFGNFELATMGGFVFFDTNGNSQLDSGESPLANWTVKLESGAQVQPKPTNTLGYYEFILPMGTHEICPDLPDGWTQTYPELAIDDPSCYTIEVNTASLKDQELDFYVAQQQVGGQEDEDLFPSVNITANPGTLVKAGTDVTLTANVSSGDGPITYQWGGACNGTANAATINDANGTYNCTVTVTDADGDTAQAQITITSQDNQPSVFIIADPGTRVQSGNTIRLRAVANGGDTPYAYRWSGDCSGSSVQVNAPTAVGTHTCQVRVTDEDGDTANAGVTVTIFNAPATGDDDDVTDNVGNPSDNGDDVTTTTTDEEAVLEDGEVLGVANTCEATAYGTLGGRVFADENADSIYQDSEDGVSSVSIRISARDAQNEWQLIETVESDEDGYWELTDICPGYYRITLDKETLSDNYQLATSDVVYENLDSDEDNTNINFLVARDEGFMTWWLCLIPLLLILLGAAGYTLYRKREATRIEHLESAPPSATRRL